MNWPRRAARPAAGPHAELPDPERSAHQAAIGLRRWRTIAGAFLVYLAYTLPELFEQSTLVITVGLVLMVAFAWLYLGPLPPAAWGDQQGRALAAVGGMAALAAVYLVVVGPGGLAFGTYICVGLVISLPPTISLPLLVALSAALVQLPQYVGSWHLVGQQWGAGLLGLLTGAAVLAVRLNVSQQRQLYQAREEVERLAADQERLRIARDLHDLLGHALTTVVVKSELAARFARIDAERAAQEMEQVAALARQALADVRSTVSGYRGVSLVGELASAREVLRAAGISAELPASAEQVPAQLQELFGWALREAVTNAVRHSRARSLVVRLTAETGSVGIDIVDDGTSATRAVPWGSGLRGLNERVVAAGGQLAAASPAEGGFHVRVKVPITPAGPSTAPAASVSGASERDGLSPMSRA